MILNQSDVFRTQRINATVSSARQIDATSPIPVQIMLDLEWFTGDMISPRALIVKHKEWQSL